MSRMASTEFTFDCSDLEYSLDELVTEFPKQLDTAFKNMGKQFAIDAKKAAKKSGINHPDDIVTLKEWKRKLSYPSLLGRELKIYNRNRVFHLLENGHKVKSWGKVVGDATAFKFTEATREEWQQKDKFNNEIEKAMTKAFKKAKL